MNSAKDLIATGDNSSEAAEVEEVAIEEANIGKMSLNIG
jgi:hypothetical protein